MERLQSVEKILRSSRIFSFLCIRLGGIGKEDSNERNPSGVSFVFVQVAFALQRRGEGAPAPCDELTKNVSGSPYTGGAEKCAPSRSAGASRFLGLI